MSEMIRLEYYSPSLGGEHPYLLLKHAVQQIHNRGFTVNKE